MIQSTAGHPGPINVLRVDHLGGSGKSNEGRVGKRRFHPSGHPHRRRPMSTTDPTPKSTAMNGSGMTTTLSKLWAVLNE
jgi:hypothetical protein